MGTHLYHRWFYSQRVGPVCAVSLQFVMLLGLLVSACHADAPLLEVVQVKVQRVGFDPVSRSPVILLLDEARTKLMPIWVGQSEARAIELELRGEPAPRPLTHDLLKNILVQVGVKFEKVVVSELKDSTYYAWIHLSTASAPLQIDSRPSDAIALALRFERPIFVAKNLLESTFSVETESQQVRNGPASVHLAGVTVQNISADLAVYFQLDDTSGVLVADVDAAGQVVQPGQVGQIGQPRTVPEQLQRGDIILTVAGQTIHNIEEFQDKMGGQAGQPGQTVAMQIQRNGKALGISFPLALE